MATALDFPASPTNGQKHPQPPVSGQPVYTWDGLKWTTFGGTLDSGGAATALPLVDADTALVGLSTKYAREDHVHPKFATAEVDALAYNGIQINGGMEVSQEHGSSPIIASGYVCDGWQLLKHASSQAVFSAATATDPTNRPAGIFSAMMVNITFGEATADPNNYVAALQAIEGYRVQRLGWGTVNAKPVTIGFWTAHSRAGTYTVAAHTLTSDRSFVAPYTQNVAGAWEFKTVTINGDTAGTWGKTEASALRIFFTIHTGTGLVTSLVNTWNVGGYLAATGQVAGAGSAGDYFRLTGVVMLPGPEQLTATRSALFMRPYGHELALCQRYYRKYSPLLVSGYGAAGNSIFGYWTVDPPMRANPALTFSGVTYSNASGLVQNGVSVSTFGASAVITATASGYASFTAALDARL